MGENDNRPLIPVYVYDESRNIVTRLDQMQTLTDSDLLPDDPGPPGEPAILADPVIITGRFIPEPRMSRKRFIRLLMSRGISRNDAVVTAECTRESGWAYVDAWWMILLYNMK